MRPTPRRACVTGAGGFIASHLVELLLADGWEVAALVHYHGRGGWGWLEHLREAAPRGLSVTRGDVTDAGTAERAVDGCGVVFHLAGLVAVPYSYQAPEPFFRTNVLGTLAVAEAARRRGVGRLVHVSTSEVYGTAATATVGEGHPRRAQSPYAASKIGADAVVESYALAFGLPAVTVRPFNTYGPRQSGRAVIPAIVSQALRGRTVRLGATEPVRDLTFVDDTVAGLVCAAEADGACGETVNLGTGEAVSVGELAQLILEIVAVDGEIVVEPERVRPQQSEVMRLVSDNAKATRLLGWKPKVPLRDGLRRTAAWIAEHLDLYPPGEYLR